MEVRGGQSSVVSPSLEVLLDEMEVSTGPDFLSLDMITANSEDLLLGGEVEVVDAAEVRSQYRVQLDSETAVDEAGSSKDVASEIGEERVEDAIGMEVEVSRKSTSCSESCSPGLPHEQEKGGEWAEMEVGAVEVVEPASDAGIGEQDTPEIGSQGEERRHTPEAGLVEGKRTPEVGLRDERRVLGRKRELYVPPVTEWRDLLDSQDILLEFANRSNKSGGKKGEEMEEGREGIRGQEEREWSEEDTEKEQVEGEGVVGEDEEEEVQVGGGEDVEGEGERGDVGGVEEGVVEEGESGEQMKGDEENDEVVDVVEMEHRKPTEHCESPHQQTSETTAGETSRRTPPSQSELFLPSLYRCLSCRGKPVTLTGCALEVAESFLDQEENLLQRAKWVPPRANSSRKLQESRPIRSSVAPRKPVEVKGQNTAHRDHSPAGATPVISTSLRLPASVAVSPTDARNRQCINPPEKNSLSSNGGRSLHTRSEVSNTLKGNKAKMRENVLELSPRGPNIPLKYKPRPQPRETRTQFAPQTTGREKQKVLESQVVRGRRYEVPEVIDSSFFDHESQMEGSGGEGEREEPRVTLCSPSTQGSSSGQENPVEPCSTPQDPIVSDRDNMARGSSAVERRSISSPVKERNLKQPTGPQSLITTYSDSQTATSGSSNVDKGNGSVEVRNPQQSTVPPGTSIASAPTSTDLTSLLVISSVTSEGGELRVLSPTRRNLQGALNSALEGRTEETSENETVREEGERRVREEGKRSVREEKEVRVSSGEEGMPWIRKCNVKIPKLSVSTPTARSLRCRAEDANIADVLSDLCLSVAPRHCSDSWSEFHDFVLRLPLPSVRDAPTAGSRKTTRRPQKRKRTECKETNKKPLSGDPLPSTLVSSLLTHLRDKPVHTAGEGSQADSWSSIDRLLDRLPPPPAPAAQEMREQRETTESQRAACSENKGPHQRGHQLENSVPHQRGNENSVPHQRGNELENSVPHQRGNELENSVPHQRGNENSVPHQRGNELENSVPHQRGNENSVPHQRGNELENSVPHQRGNENSVPHQRGNELENSVPHQRGNELENSVPHQRGNENSVPHQRGNELENSVPHQRGNELENSVPHQRGNELENSVPHQRGNELENSVPHQRGNELENSVPHQRGNENSVPHQDPENCPPSSHSDSDLQVNYIYYTASLSLMCI